MHGLYTESTKSERERMKEKIKKLVRSHNSLKDKKSEYAEAHMKLLAVYDRIYTILLDA